MKDGFWWVVATLLVTVTSLDDKATAGPPLPCDGLDDCKRKCAKRDGASCLRQAVFEGEDLPLLKRACDLRHAPGCVALGRRLEKGGDADRHTKAVALYEDACKAKEQDGCLRLGELLELGVGKVTKDPERATSLFRTGCEAGHEPSCVAQAMALAKGTGGVADPAEARRRLERACVDGSATACARYGGLLRYGTIWGWAKDIAKARVLREQGCKLGHAETCKELALDALVATDKALRALGCQPGAAYRCEKAPQDPSIAENVALAARFNGLLCQASSDPRPCAAAGAETKDPEAKSKWHALGCELGDPLACHQGGALLERADAEAVGRAHALYARACALGSAHDCVLQAQMVLAGRGAPADPKAGMAQLNKLCRAKAYGACEAIADALERGVGGKPDLRGAAAMYAKLCPNPKAEHEAETDDDGFYWESPACEGRLMHEGLRAAATLARACDKGDAPSCLQAGRKASWFYYRFPDQVGSSSHDNPGLAFERGCQLGLGEACAAEASWWTEPNRRSSAPEGKVRAAMTRGCDLEYASACTTLAEWLLKGEHGAADVGRGRAMLEGGCQQGLDADCNALVRWLVEGPDPALREPRRGLELAAEACTRMKGPQTCNWVKRTPAILALVAQEEACAGGDGAACFARAKEASKLKRPERLLFLQRACEAGNAEGCEALAAERAKDAPK